MELFSTQKKMHEVGSYTKQDQMCVCDLSIFCVVCMKVRASWLMKNVDDGQWIMHDGECIMVDEECWSLINNVYFLKMTLMLEKNYWKHSNQSLTITLIEINMRRCLKLQEFRMRRLTTRFTGQLLCFLYSLFAKWF